MKRAPWVELCVTSAWLLRHALSGGFGPLEDSERELIAVHLERTEHTIQRLRAERRAA